MMWERGVFLGLRHPPWLSRCYLQLDFPQEIPLNKRSQDEQCQSLGEAVKKPLRGSRSLILSSLYRFGPVKLVLKTILLS